jgi:hypothetical protein
MDSLLSFPVGLFHPLQHAGLSRRSPSCRQRGNSRAGHVSLQQFALGQVRSEPGWSLSSTDNQKAPSIVRGHDRPRIRMMPDTSHTHRADFGKAGNEVGAVGAGVKC